MRPTTESERRAAERMLIPDRRRYDPRSDGKEQWVKLTDGAKHASRPGGGQVPFSRLASDSSFLLQADAQRACELEARFWKDASAAVGDGEDAGVHACARARVTVAE